SFSRIDPTSQEKRETSTHYCITYNKYKNITLTNLPHAKIVIMILIIKNKKINNPNNTLLYTDFAMANQALSTTKICIFNGKIHRFEVAVNLSNDMAFYCLYLSIEYKSLRANQKKKGVHVELYVDLYLDVFLIYRSKMEAIKKYRE
ncbi:hypothetical protein PanWU01x14_005950, partial [Parasponia andersonii]